jgi:predicted TIM-barrel fold metal-dependent hydrolase
MVDSFLSGPVSSDTLLEKTGELYNFMIDSFGPERCMFESNFPVDKMGGASYHILWNMFKKLCVSRKLSTSRATFCCFRNKQPERERGRPLPLSVFGAA